MLPFDGLKMDSIELVVTAGAAELAAEDLLAAGHVGFDTESKPTFHKGQKSGGPHLYQFSTLEKAYLFPSHQEEVLPFVKELLMAGSLVKVGFDLRGDLQQISGRLGIRPDPIVDLGRKFRELGYRNTIGASSAVAMMFQRCLRKSKSVTTSNWALKELSERQMIYAANDAYAAIRVFHEFQNFREAIAKPAVHPVKTPD